MTDERLEAVAGFLYELTGSYAGFSSRWEQVEAGSRPWWLKHARSLLALLAAQPSVEAQAPQLGNPQDVASHAAELVFRRSVLPTLSRDGDRVWYPNGYHSEAEALRMFVDDHTAGLSGEIIRAAAALSARPLSAGQQSGQQRKPAKLKKFELLAVLRDIVRGVESGDTLEGNIEFLLDYDEGADGWEVLATYRTGNLQGQGGYQLIHAPTEQQPSGQQSGAAQGEQT